MYSLFISTQKQKILIRDPPHQLRVALFKENRELNIYLINKKLLFNRVFNKQFLILIDKEVEFFLNKINYKFKRNE